MEITVDNNKKIVQIWLEKNDDNNDSLNTIIAHEKTKYNKYIIAVFKSGNRNLLEGTKDLLVRNKTLS